MIWPTLTVAISKMAGNDVFGQPQFVVVAPEKVSPVKLKFTAKHTSVRTDSTATHGHAYEAVADIVIMAVPATRMAINDRLLINGYAVRVVSKEPKYTVYGKLDHHEISCEMWT